MRIYFSRFVSLFRRRRWRWWWMAGALHSLAGPYFIDFIINTAIKPAMFSSLFPASLLSPVCPKPRVYTGRPSHVLHISLFRLTTTTATEQQPYIVFCACGSTFFPAPPTVVPCFLHPRRYPSNVYTRFSTHTSVIFTFNISACRNAYTLTSDDVPAPLPHTSF